MCVCVSATISLEKLDYSLRLCLSLCMILPMRAMEKRGEGMSWSNLKRRNERGEKSERVEKGEKKVLRL